MKIFPYKTLIWAVVVIIAMFLFREALSRLILQMEEVTILDKVKIKVSKEDSKALFVADSLYQIEINQMNQDVALQQKKISNLQTTITKLLGKVENCQEAKTMVNEAKRATNNLFKSASQIQTASAKLKAVHLVKKIKH